MIGFKAFVFEGSKTGMKALDTLEDYTPVYSWIDDVAVFNRPLTGAEVQTVFGLKGGVQSLPASSTR